MRPMLPPSNATLDAVTAQESGYRFLHDPLLWSALALLALVLYLPYSKPLFASLFPALERPVYQQEPFADRKSVV